MSLRVLNNPPAASSSGQSSSQIAEDLRRLDVGEVRWTEHDRGLYGTDASLYQVRPIGVVIPRSTEVLPALIRHCNKSHIPLLPRGGGTSLAGQCTNEAVVMDLTPRCRGLVSVEPDWQSCIAEAGIGIEELNRLLAERKTGAFFAPDPATSNQASLGGCIGNNAAGSRSIRYGRTSENILGLDVVLTTGERVWLEPGAGRRSAVALRLATEVAEVIARYAGEIRARFPKLVRRNAGYELDSVLDQLERGVAVEDLDLSKLLCGSEGTLAVVASARLKLTPLPLRRGLAVVSFPSVDAAIDAVVPILRTRPSAVELLDDTVIQAAMGNTEYRRYVELLPAPPASTPGGKSTPEAVLYVEYQTERSDERLGDFFNALRPVVPDAAIATYEDPAEINKAWALRKAGEALLHGLPGHAKPITFVEDNSVPVENLREFVRGFKAIVARHNTSAAYWAHASVGVLHVRPMIDLHEPGEREKMRAIAIEVAELARSCGGVMSGEHGDGRVRGPLLEAFYGPVIMEAFREIKRIFDPNNVLNPGNVVALPPMEARPIESISERLRLDAQVDAERVNAIPTYFEYPGEGGFNHTLEGCNGAGFCRKREPGVMCPSYRATLDERHSTRGRANALRLAVTNHETPAWNDAETKATLDLCLSCKACKTECPTNVDVSQLKAEYYAQGYREVSPPLQAKVFSRIRTLNKLGAMMPGVANWVSALPAVRGVMNRVLKLHPKRSLPAFAPSLFRWDASRSGRRKAGPTVVLWTDCFMTYTEPGIGVAATLALEAMGYQVKLAGDVCCGRAAMSNGLLPDAIRTAQQSLEVLRPMVEDPAVEAFIVLEPSCLAALQDEWLKLKMDVPVELRKKLAAKAMLIEQFAEARWKPPTTFKPLIDNLLLHGHCHQKALWGETATLSLLKKLTTGNVTAIPSTCCGMAGAFGYTQDRYDLSMKIGELSLFPAVRNTPANTTLVAPGTSCRHQIKDGTHQHALHPAEVLARTLVPSPPV
jgi:FAD/FMN-containing dehydrogenase/Fe-S oxidoreductase